MKNIQFYNAQSKRPLNCYSKQLKNSVVSNRIVFNPFCGTANFRSLNSKLRQFFTTLFKKNWKINQCTRFFTAVKIQYYSVSNRLALSQVKNRSRVRQKVKIFFIKLCKLVSWRLTEKTLKRNRIYACDSCISCL